MKTIIYFLIFILMISVVSAESVTRDMPSSAGNSFTLTYNMDTTGLTTYWGVAITDDIISGDCYFIHKTSGDRLKHRSFGIVDPTITSSNIVVEADSSGTCTFRGTYQFSDGTGIFPEETIIGDTSITISTTCNPDCSCASNTCQGSTCSDGCGGTCSGTKDCTTCQESWSCTSWTTCSSGTQSRTCTDSNNCGTTNDRPITSRTCTPDAYCGDGTCNSGETCTSCEQDCGTCTTPPPTDSDCIPYIQDKVAGKCEFNKTAQTLLIILIFLFIISFLK